ncbi:translational protein [Lithospermum erythrorhizon]|uniref:Translational protein n=1 Tax=Lithospermum erythrorhizon TaxID=34254 RepID=A0AAV3PAT3_LITER
MASKQAVILALCKHLSIDQKGFLSDSDSDLKTTCITIFKSTPNGDAMINNNEFVKWIEFSEKFLADGASEKYLSDLNQDLVSKAVLQGNGLKPSAADIVVFSAIHASVIGLSDSDRDKFPHLVRWMDYIQNKENIGQLFDKILVPEVHFDPPAIKTIKKTEADSSTKKTLPKDNGSGSTKEADTKAQPPAEKKASAGKKTTTDVKKVPEKGSDDKDKDLSVSLLKIQIGVIRKAWKHPSADSLLVEEIDVGEATPRQVVSGLANYCTPEQLTDRRVVLVTNVKPGKLRDVMSQGLVLCASDKEKKQVEPLIAPNEARVGECVVFTGHEGKPEEVLNPKKKQLEKISEHLSTDDQGVATYRGIPFMTSAGPCTSSIPNGSIK